MTFPQRVAFVGATGQVGFPLCHELLRPGHTVTAVFWAAYAVNRFHLDALRTNLAFHADLTDLPALTQTLAGCTVVAVLFQLDLPQ